MKYEIITSTRFKKDLKRCEKRGLDMHLVFDAMKLLAANGTLPAHYRPHKLSGNRKGQIPEQARLPVAFGNVTYSPTG